MRVKHKAHTHLKLEMPLPNLRGGSSYNTSSSNVQAENYSGGASYREQVREKMLNTPRQTNVDYKKSIDLTISRDNFRSSSRLKLQNKNPDSDHLDDSFDAQTKRSNNNKSQSARNRQIVFYNKTYVPSNEDTSSQISIQDDEPNPNQSNISPNNSMSNLFTNNTNSDVNIQADKNRQPKPRKESIFIDDSRRSFKSRRSDYEDKGNDVNSSHKKENRVKNRYETSRPNSRDSFYQSDDENAHTNHDDNDDVMVRRPKSTYSTRRRNRNDESDSSIDLNNNKNVNTNFSIGEQEANGRRSRIEINSNGFNENESNGQQNVRMTPRRARTFNTNRYSLNIDHFKASDEFDVVESKSTNDFNLRSTSRVGFREDDKADSNENNANNNRNPPVPAPRKRNDNNAFTNKLNLNEINDFRIKRTSTANSSKLLTPKISYIPSSPRSTSHQSEESLNRSFNNKASSSNSANLENRRVEITQEYIRYQRQQSPIIKSNENLQSRNGRLANNNNSFSYDSKTERQHSTRPNSINRNWQ